MLPSGGAPPGSHPRPRSQAAEGGCCRLDGVLPDLPWLERGAGPPVLLLHAVGDSGRAFLPVLAHLPADRRYLAPDLRGHGDADKPDTGYAVGDFVEDVLQFLDNRGIGSLAVVGSSSGGLLAQRLAADHPDRVDALVLVGAPHSLQGLSLPALFAGLSDPVEPDFVRRLNDGMTFRPLDDGIAEAATQESLKVPARVWRLTLQGLLDEPPPSVRARIAARALVLQGEQDAVLGVEQAERLCRDLPVARLVLLPDTGHLPIWECPDRVAAEITAFL